MAEAEDAPTAEVEEQPEAEPEAEAEAAAEPEAEVEAPKEEAAAEPTEEELKQPAAEPEAEAPKEEPKKKKSKKKKKSSAPSGDGTNPDAEAAWNKICKKGGEVNWYILKLQGKPGKSTTLEFVSEGTGGAAEVCEFLKDKQSEILFGILRCITTDDSKSVRNKFIYLRFIGTGVKTMVKAKLTPSLGKIDGAFPVKHLTCDINESCEADLAPVKLAKELLRVGGAHKPDKMAFGPDQEVDVRDL